MALERLPLTDATLWWQPVFLDAPEAIRLFDALRQGLCWRQQAIRLFGRSCPQPRLSAWYGDDGASYRYSGLLLQPLPWPPALLAVRQQLETGLATSFNSVLANLYRDGRDSMGWHSDDEPELGPEPIIASLSLGATRRFQLRHKRQAERYSLDLIDGSLLVMAGETQRYWRHQVPKTRHPVGERINLTFRMIVNDARTPQSIRHGRCEETCP